MTMKLIYLYIPFFILSLSIYANGQSIKTFKELNLDTDLKNLLIKIENDPLLSIDPNFYKTDTINRFETFYVSEDSTFLWVYSKRGNIDLYKLVTMDSIVVPLFNNVPLSYSLIEGETNVVKYTLCIYGNQLLFFKDNDCISKADIEYLDDVDLYLFKGKKRMIVTSDWKKYKVLGYGDIERSHNINVFCKPGWKDIVDVESTIYLFDSKKWEERIITSGRSPKLTSDHKKIVFMGKDSIENFSVYDLSDNTVSKIFDVQDSLYSDCDIGDYGDHSEILHYKLGEKECFAITLFNNHECEEREKFKNYVFVFDENGIIEVSCFMYDENGGNKHNCQYTIAK
jgi:hypothetical protein